MSSSYSLTVVNDSELTDPTFAVFATLPTTSDYATLSMAWLTQQIDAQNNYVFTWDMVWGFAWTAHGTGKGYQWTGTGKLPADPNAVNGCKATFSYNGDFQLSPATGTPTGGTLWITDEPTVPLPSKEPSSVAITLDGNPACATDAGPNLFQTFTLHPTYYIDAGYYVQGQMVDGTSVSMFEELAYTGGNTALTATLNQDNTWSVQPSASLDFSAVLGPRRGGAGTGSGSKPGCGCSDEGVGAPSDLGTCYAGANCQGQILGEKMRTNACRNLGGKSWYQPGSERCHEL